MPPVQNQNILTDPLNGADVVQPNWIYGTSQLGAAKPFLTARSSSNPSVPGGLPGGGTDTPGTGALQLTDNTNNQGSFVIYNKPINSSAGLSIQFQLYSYGGTNPGADGISFFLIDGSQSPTTGGAVGGGLGYSSDSTPGIAGPGIVGGYLGIGFDEYGNFSASESGPGGSVQIPESIAVRGSAANNYAYLTGKALSSVTTLPTGTTINSTTATSRSGAARSVQIDLDPQGNLSVHFDPTGTDTFNSSDEVISNYNVATTNGALPSTFKFGFAASTGGSTDYHAVNNLSVSTVSGSYTPLVSFPPVNATVTPNTPLSVIASIDVASTLPVIIPLNFAGTAVQGTDYSLSATSITISPGQTTGNVLLKDISPTTNGKTVQISLGTPMNAALSPQDSTLTATLAPATGNSPSLIWNNPASSTSASAVWNLTGSQVSAAAFTQLNGTVVQPGNGWKLISGNVDFNGDGNPDMLWFNTASTQTAVWYMQPDSNGVDSIIGSSSYVKLPNATTPVQPGNGWQLDAVTTKLGSSPVLVWENPTTGNAAIWQLNIDSITGQATINLANSKLITDTDGVTPLQTGGANAGWKIIGAGNFGSSGAHDLLWFNTKTTQTVVWQMNGTSISSAGFVQTSNGITAIPGLGWQPVEIGSVDGTGTDQIIWQNGTAVAVWDFGSNYTLSAKSVILSQRLAAGEQIQAVADIDLNNTVDLLARNVTSNSDATRVYALDPTTFQISTPTTARYITLAGQSAPVVTGDPLWDIVDSTIVLKALA